MKVKHLFQIKRQCLKAEIMIYGDYHFRLIVKERLFGVSWVVKYYCTFPNREGVVQWYKAPSFSTVNKSTKHDLQTLLSRSYTGL